MTKVLVAYASKHNSTAEIANAIGTVLKQSNTLQVDIRSVEAVEDTKRYDAIVLGSAVYAGQWQPKAADFLKQHKTELEQRLVWLFSSGPVGEGDPQTLLKGWKFPVALQPIADRIKPRDIALFHGNVDPSKLSLFEQLLIKGGHAPVGDFRDWDMIRAWATSIAQVLEIEAHSISLS
jgi:menaquinone-dependent protoporphyrinogen oxidase